MVTVWQKLKIWANHRVSTTIVQALLQWCHDTQYKPADMAEKR